MRGAIYSLAVLTLTAVPALAQPAPSGGSELAVGQMVEGVKCQLDPTQTYSLYLPGNFTPERRWPGLLVFDPRGRSVPAAELFRDAAETYGWVILSSDNTRSDGPMEPNQKALAALWPEVHIRHSIDPRRIYVAGFSGGAMIGWALGRATGGRATGELAGVIGTGGHLEPEVFETEMHFPCFGAAGDTDFNYAGMRAVHSQLERWNTPNRLEIFDGPHRWMPSELATEGVEWMELQAMKQGLRPRDDELIEDLYSKDLARAHELARAGRELPAMRRYNAVAATFEGLREVDTARQSAARLDGRPAVVEARKQERRWDGFEALYRKRLPAALALLREEPPVSVRRFAAELRLTELQKRAEAEAYEGVVARRLLETLLTQTSFYLTRDLFARQSYSSAATVLTIASEIRPQRPDIWYNLACALARSGGKKKALAALKRAVDAGFSNAEQLARDPDLESLRREEGFRQLTERLGG